MAWSGRERRRKPRSAGNPTYIVDDHGGKDDAPEWEPPQPFWARWKRNATDFAKRTRYDAYPDHRTPFEDVKFENVGPPGPTVEYKHRLPKPRSHSISLFVKRNGKMREVKLLGLSLEIAVHRLNRKMVAGWVMDEISKTLQQMEEDEMTEQEPRRLDNEGQGLAEYALILALVAIVVIAALILLGGQIAETLREIGGQIPGGSPTP
jgi:pilus assembly protein Flp/PilA